MLFVVMVLVCVLLASVIFVEFSSVCVAFWGPGSDGCGRGGGGGWGGWGDVKEIKVRVGGAGVHALLFW